MNNNYFSLGLMSGTSMDGVDASIFNQMERMNIRLFLMNTCNMIKIFIKN